MEIEIGRSSYLNGENLIYMKINDKGLIFDETTGRELVDAVANLAVYLGYDKSI